MGNLHAMGLSQEGFYAILYSMDISWQSDQRTRAEVVRRCIDEHGSGMQDMVQDFDDARDSDNEMEESTKAFN